MQNSQLQTLVLYYGSVTRTHTDDTDAADGAFRIYPYLSTLNVSVRNRSYRIRSVRIGVEHPQP
jgi:hypothetical protein